MSPNIIWGQHKITSNDELNIKRKSLTLINSLVDKYNQLLDSDSYDRNVLIENMTLPQQEGISDFLSDQVIIEDEFSTSANIKKSERDKKVDVYFKDIGLYYGRQDNGDFANEGKKIQFTNITTSKIMAISEKDPMFLQIFYDVVYDGIDSRTKKRLVQPCHRVAEMQIRNVKNIWQVTIKSIRYFDEKTLAVDYSKNVTVEKVEKVENDPNEAITSTEKRIVSRNPIIQAYKSNNKWGLRNVDTDKAIISATFDDIEDFTEEGLALININGNWGFVNTNGEIIIKCEYDYAESFGKERKARAKVQKGMEVFFIDKAGTRVK